MKYLLSYDYINGNISENSILLLATMEHIIKKTDLYYCLNKWTRDYKNLDYGYNLKNAIKNKTPYNSYGILGAIRVIPYVFLNLNYKKTLEISLENVKKTHDNKINDKYTQILVKFLHMIKSNIDDKIIYKTISREINLNKIDINDSPDVKSIIPIAIKIYFNSKSVSYALKQINEIKYNLNSLSIIVLTAIYLKNRQYDNNLYLSYLKNADDRIQKCLINFCNIKQ